MDADKNAKLRDGLDAALSNLMAVLPGADNEPGWEIPTGEEGWTVRQMLAHLAVAEASMNLLVEHAIRVAGAGGPASELVQTGSDGRPFDIDFWNSRQVAKRADHPPSALRLELTETRAKTLRALKNRSLDELATAAWHPTIGATTVEGMYKIMSIHMRDHTRAVKKALREGLHGRYWADVE
ncbi:MAG TPA: maleylpyruvate isomerase N-terminal domain-containing protein [Chloroflexia bacterium]|nr:maleylpyruvate isomerase N-terminal domain-containing protein [Chloroflexia bacterium]